MAKVHDKYVVELAEIIKGYGNDPDINDPFCLSEFYRFYEVPNVCVSAENFKKMRPLSDYTEEIEPESISKWKKEFREYVDSLDIARDDWKGIIEYIDELPSIQPDTTIYDSNVVKKGINDGDRTSGDCISRQQATDVLRKMQTYKLFAGDDLLLIDQAGAQTELMMLPSVQPEEIALHESCTNCPLYDKDRHKCPRFNKVIPEALRELQPVQPETAKRIVGKSRDGMTLWYQCDTCNEPVDAQDNYCRGCGRRLMDDLISRQVESNPLEKCYTCKHVYQRVSDADTLYCRCRKGCRYEEFKPKRSNGNSQWYEGEN